MFELTSVTNPAYRLGEITVVAKTEPGTEAAIKIWFEDGVKSEIPFRDRNEVTADADGNLVFEGQFGPMYEGVATIEITLNNDGKSGLARLFSSIQMPAAAPAPEPDPEANRVANAELTQPRLYGGEPILKLQFLAATETVQAGSADAIEIVLQSLNEAERQSDVWGEIKITRSDGTVSSVPAEPVQKADANGRMSWRWQVPADAAPGDAEVMISTSMGSYLGTAITYVTIEAADFSAPDVPIYEPNYRGEPVFKLRFASVPTYARIGSGETVTVVMQTLKVSERRADLHLDIKVTLSDGTVTHQQADTSQVASDDGLVTWTWEVPVGTVAGKTRLAVNAKIIGMPSEAEAITYITYIE